MDRNSVREIVFDLETVIPSGLQEEWDNSGLIIGFEDREVHRILTCLELDMRNVEEAISKDVQMVITHHPPIFGGLTGLRTSVPSEAVILELIKNDISVYASHTPFDKIAGGNNDALAGLLELKNVTDLAGRKVPDVKKMLKEPSEMHVGRIGELKKPLPFSQVIDFCCDALLVEPMQLRVVGDLNREITKVGICTGAGAEYALQAERMGAQAFITGDLKYHQAREAAHYGMCVIDAGHYGTEKIFPAVMKVQLEKFLDPQIEIIASAVDIDPFTML